MHKAASWPLAAVIGLAVGSAAAAPAPKPGFIHGDVVVTSYPAGGASDLLTGGLGAARLADPTPLAIDPLDAESLRTAAIYNNYRALVDTSAGNGYGTLFGPTVAPTTADAEGRIYGTEYLAFAKGRRGDQNIALMVQIPEAFDPARACIVTGPSSGSRGIYGAIGTSGEWGLKHGCAVAYTDKGTGTGAHNLALDTVGLLRGERAPADEAGRLSTFTAGLSDAQRAAFNARFPDRWAFKHAHSGLNPEADWDDHVVLSLSFALWALNTELAASHGPTLGWANTLVIASSVSNGGAASLRAAEIAPKGMIDGVVVSEPNVNPVFDGRFVIRQGNGPALRRHSRPLYDYLTLIDLFQGCANLAAANATAPLNLTPAVLGQNRCASLARANLLGKASLEQQAAQAQRIVNAYGILEAQNAVAPAYWSSFVDQAVVVGYASAYARASVRDRVCGFSLAATDNLATSPTFNQVVPLPAAAEGVLFASSNGIPPTGGLSVVNDRSPGGPLRDQFSLSPSTGIADQNLDGHRCLRSLATGQKGGRPLAGTDLLRYQQVQASIAQLQADGALGGIPAILVHGRSDALIAPNHTSRAYYALSRLRDGARSKISYVEVTNAHHLDIFNAFPGFNNRFVPLHHYFVEAMDRMYAHLTAGGALPASQLVRTTPRAVLADGSLEPIGSANLPPIAADPKPADAITFDGRILRIPE
ncbi:MAG TPA: 3-hydroxybutyrate oligomer hydrolase family protein [Geminicoccaceae bacterium]|nr:3-hydroxybutyrate oligomer hydrolase family protein [Geminicoccus sp.]HMU51661.1 3-hydroxybutyrate oligomer hydrolase family protein [Geminicoccaceae bacterium]